MTTVTITAARLHQRFGSTGKTIYYLPARTVVRPDGSTATTEPGGFASKSETLNLVRSLYAERPLMVVWPDGKATEVKK